MNLIRRILPAGFFLALSLPCHSAMISGIVAVVNDAVITYQEVMISFAPLEEQLFAQYQRQPKVFEEKRGQALAEKIEDLVERQLVLSHFRTAGYNVKILDAFVDDQIQERIKERFGDRISLMKTLQAQGKTYEAYHRDQRDQIIVDLLRQQFTSSEKVIISPFKIEAYFQENADKYKVADQVKLRMIVLNKTGGSNADAVRRLADEIHSKLKAGASFAELASIYSDGAQRAQAGDRGWVDRDFFKKELSDSAFSLKAGEISAVIDLPEACYIMLVEEVRAAHVKPLQDVRDEIEGILKSQGRERIKKRWVERLKAKAFVAYY
ncbi:MAG: peptidylprolyl isomerase [Opitutaceae bacterium]|nr:peptidylprolyl isomerase [Verrucomicrobiales bacterium]